MSLIVLCEFYTCRHNKERRCTLHCLVSIDLVGRCKNLDVPETIVVEEEKKCTAYEPCDICMGEILECTMYICQSCGDGRATAEEKEGS